MRTIRVRKVNSPRMVEALTSAGFSASSGHPFHVDYVDCWDENMDGEWENSAVHPSEEHPEEWDGIETNASGNEAHRVFVSAGIVSDETR